MNFEPSHSALEAWLYRGKCRAGNVNDDDGDKCNLKTFFISSRKILNYLPRATHISRVCVDLSFLSPADIAYFVSIAASPPYNISRILVRHNPNGDHQRQLMKLLNELHQQKLHHLESLSFKTTMPLTNPMLPLLQKVILANIRLTTLGLTFDTIDPTIACFLIHVLSNGLPLLKKLHLTFHSQAQTEPDIDADQDAQDLAWIDCFRRSAKVCRQIETVQVNGYKAFYFLSQIFPNIKCSIMSCEDCTANTQIFQEKAIIAMFHQCIQLNLTLTWRFSWLAPAISTIQTLTLDVRQVRALDDDIADDLVKLLSHPSPNLRDLTILQRSMPKLQFLRLCAVFHRRADYPNLCSITLNANIPDLDDECRIAFLQMIRTCSTLVASSASCMDNHTEKEAQYLGIANKVRLPYLLRQDRDNGDDGENDDHVIGSATSPPLALWSHILSALHPHPSIMFTLLKEKSSELIPQHRYGTLEHYKSHS